jgi:hypothetical protein
MENKVPKYNIGDILKLNEDEKIKQIILCISHWFYDETGLRKEVYYYIKRIDDDTYPPSPIKESSIDKYYTKYNNYRTNNIDVIGEQLK